MKTLLRAAGVLAAVLVVCAVAIQLLVKPDDFRPMLEAQLSERLARQVKIGELSLSLLSGGLSASRLSVSDDPSFSQAPFVAAESVKLEVDLPRLLKERKVHVTGVNVVKPAIVLLQSPEGKWNYSSLGVRSHAGGTGPGASGDGFQTDLSVKSIRLSGGRLTVGQTRGSRKPLVLEEVDIELQDYARTARFPFRVRGKVAGGGSIDLEGNAGPIDPTNASFTPVDGKIRIEGLDLAAPGVLAPGTGVAGIVGLKADASADGRQFKLRGRLTADRLKVVHAGSPAKRRLEADLVLEHDMARRFGVLRKGDILLGGARASLTGRYAQQHEAAAVRMDLSGSKMALEEIAEMLPSLGVVLPAGARLQGGTATATVGIQGPVQHLSASGPVAIEAARLTGFDLGAKMAVIQALAGVKRGPDTDIEVLSADVRTSPSGTSLDNIRLVVRGVGEITGAGTVSPTKDLAFRMRARVQTSGALMRALGQKGDTTVPILISGTASEPVFRPDMETITAEKVEKLRGSGAIGRAAGSLLERLRGNKSH